MSSQDTYQLNRTKWRKFAVTGWVLAAVLSAAAALLNTIWGSPLALILLRTVLAGMAVISAFVIRRGKSSPT